jgi:hypothetical protein
MTFDASKYQKPRVKFEWNTEIGSYVTVDGEPVNVYDGAGHEVKDTSTMPKKWSSEIKTWNWFDLPDGHSLKEQYRHLISESQ